MLGQLSVMGMLSHSILWSAVGVVCRYAITA